MAGDDEDDADYTCGALFTKTGARWYDVEKYRRTAAADRAASSSMKWRGGHWWVTITTAGGSVELTLDDFMALPATQYVLHDLNPPSGPRGPAPAPASAGPEEEPPLQRGR